jgi:hypothetical protein
MKNDSQDYRRRLDRAVEIARKSTALTALANVAAECGLTREDLRSHDRRRELAPQRQLAATALWLGRSLSLPQVAGFVNRDHGTVVYSIASVSRRCGCSGPHSPTQVREWYRHSRYRLFSDAIAFVTRPALQTVATIS